VVYFGGDDGDDIVAFDVDVDFDFVVIRICPTLFVVIYFLLTLTLTF